MAVTTVAQRRCPDGLAQAIKERNTRGLLLYNCEGRRIHRLEGDLWAVPASEGGYWQVNLAAESCPCPDFLYRCTDGDTGEAFMNCKHIVAAAIKRAKRRDASIPDDHPHACLDGFVYLGYTDDEGDEQVEAVPCRRCRVADSPTPIAYAPTETTRPRVSFGVPRPPSLGPQQTERDGR